MKLSILTILATVVSPFCVAADPLKTSTTSSLLRKRNKKKNGGNKPVIPADNVGAIVTLDHMSSDSFPGHDQVISDALIKAYNIIHQKDTYVVSSAFVEKSVSVPENGASWDVVGSNNVNNLSSYWDINWVWLILQCRTCDPDDDAAILSGSNMRTFFMEQWNLGTYKQHRAMEAEFCKQLQMTGVDELTSIEHCTIEFLLNSQAESDDEEEGPFALSG